MTSALAYSRSILRLSARILYDKRQTKIDYLPARSMVAEGCKRREPAGNRCGTAHARAAEHIVYHVFLRRIRHSSG
ncbi:MAG TPA: hypothetical protein VIJ43_09470 [Burkholderiales bacterium]